MCRGLNLDAERKVAVPDRWEQFLAGLDRAFRPSVLLRLEAVHVHWQLRRGDHIREEDELPARQLRPITEVEIFRQGVMLPPAGFVDAGPAPEARCPIEIEEASAAAAGRLFQQEMAVEEHRLHPGEQGVAPVQMAPARLDHSYL